MRLLRLTLAATAVLLLSADVLGTCALRLSISLRQAGLCLLCRRVCVVVRRNTKPCKQDKQALTSCCVDLRSHGRYPQAERHQQPARDASAERQQRPDARAERYDLGPRSDARPRPDPRASSIAIAIAVPNTLSDSVPYPFCVRGGGQQQRNQSATQRSSHASPQRGQQQQQQYRKQRLGPIRRSIRIHPGRN